MNSQKDKLTLNGNGLIIKDRREYLRIKYANQIILYTKTDEYVLNIDDLSFNGIKLKKNNALNISDNEIVSATFMDNSVLDDNSLICNVGMIKVRENDDYIMFKIIHSSPIFKQFYEMLVARHYKYC